MSKILSDIVASLNQNARQVVLDALNSAELENTRYNKIIEKSPVCTKIIDLERKLHFMSRAGIDGLKIPDVTQLYDKPYPPPGHSDVLSKLYDQHFPIALKGEITMFECPIPDMEGHEEWYVTYLIPMYNNKNDNELEFILASSANITQRKESELEAKQLNHALVKVSREAGMAEIASNVLHNVGNVLNSMTISLDLFKERKQQANLERVVKFLDFLDNNTDKLTQVFEQHDTAQAVCDYIPMLRALCVSEQQQDKQTIDVITENLALIKSTVATQQQYAQITLIKEEIFIADLVDEFLKLQRERLNDSRIYLELSIDATYRVLADKHSLIMVFTNILNNAIDAVMECSNKEKLITIKSNDGGDSISIEIEDNGVGMSREVLERIFQHGFSTKEKGHGFGLHSAALSIATMDGKVVADSRGVNQGSKFTVSLPKVS